MVFQTGRLIAHLIVWDVSHEHFQIVEAEGEGVEDGLTHGLGLLEQSAEMGLANGSFTGSLEGIQKQSIIGLCQFGQIG